jgi:folate-binding protein YgfZ
MEAQQEGLPTVLAEAHRRKGAEMGVWFGCALPNHFGDWGAEYRRGRETVALLDKNYRAYLEFTGPDRIRYLNAILTNDIKGLKASHGNISLFLNPQGHIQAEIETYSEADRLFSFSFATIRERLVAGLDKYIIMDDVTLTDLTDAYATLALEGPKTASVVQTLAGLALGSLEELETTEATVAAISCRVIKRSPGGTPGAEFLVARSQAEVLWDVLETATRDHGGGPAGYIALNSLRLEYGVPWFGYDFGEKQIPHEAGLQDSHISYTKGCYTGQEIVERVRSRGQVNRIRVSLKFDRPAAPAPNSILSSNGKEVGYVTRAGFSPRLNGIIGMGYVRREFSGIGTQLHLEDGTTSSVMAMPAG